MVLEKLRKPMRPCWTWKISFRIGRQLPYQISVYACALGHKDVARKWIHYARSIGDKDLKVKALDDPALGKIWANKW
jgi:hypothetical protein